MYPAFRLALGACAIATATVAHAATPITLPLEDLGLDTSAGIELPVPPPPKLVRPSTPELRLVIKRELMGGCQPDGRKSVVERRQVAQPRPASDPWARAPMWFRLG